MRPPELFSGAPVYTVSELVGEVSEALSTGWREVSVVGQTSEVRPYPSGHIYFALKDESARISAVMWRSDASRLKFRLEDGLEVVLRGTLSLYAARGQFQIQAHAVEPVGQGALALAFEQLKKRLAAEGLFDASRKRDLPRLPRRIGIVTSPRGAALGDILNILRRRFPDLGIVIFPARVQGEGSAGEIAEGIEVLNRIGGLDVLIVARGGGSAEDLVTFNDERVARALAASRIPTISAVGHETDWTIADYVADLRAPTPSAAAELVVGVKEEIVRRVHQSRRAILQLARRQIAEMGERLLSAARSGAIVSFPIRLARRRDRFDAAREALAQAVLSRPRRLAQRLAGAREGLGSIRRILSFEARRQRVARLADAVADRMGRRLSGARGEFSNCAGKLSALNPLSILKRGYAVAFAGDSSSPLSDASLVAPGDDVRVKLHRGALWTRVREIIREEEK